MPPREPKFLMRVWDLPIRLFHWAVTLLVIGSYVTQRLHDMTLHYLLGETLLALLLFRLAWGFVGSETALFRNFLRGPVAVIGHLGRIGRREADTEMGHNAAGGWMVLVLLGLLLAQTVMGMLAGGGRHHGPLAGLVGPVWNQRFGAWHAFNFYLILGAIALHVLAILAYAVVKRQNLTWPMITGRKRLPGRMRQPRMRGNGLAAALLLLSAMIVWVMVTRL